MPSIVIPALSLIKNDKNLNESLSITAAQCSWIGKKIRLNTTVRRLLVRKCIRVEHGTFDTDYLAKFAFYCKLCKNKPDKSESYVGGFGTLILSQSFSQSLAILRNK